MGTMHRLAATQAAVDRTSGLIDLEAACAVGATRSDMHRWTKAGLFDRVGSGLYRSTAMAWTYDTQLHLASRLSGPQGALGMQSALLAHGFDGLARGRVHILTVRHARRDRDAFVVHESVDLRPFDVVVIDGLKVTTVERSLVDVARSVSDRVLEDLVDFAIRTNRITLDSLTGRFLELGRRGRPGTVAMRSCLADRNPLIGPDSTFFEQLFDEVIAEAGFPPGIKQHRVVVEGRTYFLDRAWPEFNTWVECDSMLAHATAAQLDSDLRRQNAVMNATGLVPLRFSYRQVKTDPGSVVATLAARLPRRTRRPPGAAGR